MLYAHNHLKTADDAANMDIGGWEHLPETWSGCGLHLEKRRAVKADGRWYTVTTCGKCGAIISTLAHPKATTGVADRPLALKGSPEGMARRAAIRQYLEANGPSKARDIAKALGCERIDRIRYYLDNTDEFVKAGELMGKQRHRVEFIWTVA
jgi:hypothetical protein